MFLEYDDTFTKDLNNCYVSPNFFVGFECFEHEYQ